MREGDLQKGNKSFRLFIRDMLFAFIFSCITTDIFELMKMGGIEIVKYTSIKFMYCFIISIYVAIGRIIAEYIFYWIKKINKMSKVFGLFGSVLVGFSALEFTKSMFWLAAAVVIGYLAWKIFLEAIKKDTEHGSNRLDR